MLIAQLAQRTQERRLDDAHAALAHDRLDQDRGGLGTDRAFGRFEIAKRYLVEAVEYRAEAVEVFLLTARSERRQRPAVKRALEGNDAVAFRRTVRGVIFARGLDRAFHRLGAGIAEEHHVGEARLAQPRRDPLGLRNLVKIGDVPELCGLFGERGNQPRVRMAERVHGNAGREIQIAVAVGRGQPNALPPLEGEVNARVGR